MNNTMAQSVVKLARAAPVAPCERDPDEPP